MADILFVAIALGFMGSCVAYVFVCDRIIRNDPPPAPEVREAGLGYYGPERSES